MVRSVTGLHAMRSRGLSKIDLTVSSGVLLALGLAVSGSTIAQELPPDIVLPQIETENIHWAYSSFLGTGFYRVSGDREVFVVDMPFSWDWREASLDESGTREWGVRWQFPVTLGVHRLDFFDDFLDIDNFGTISFTPGVRLDYLVSNRWIVRGHANFGWGAETSGDEQAWIWNAGIKTRYAFERNELDWGLIGEVFHAGYSPDVGNAGSLSGFGTGVDFRHPISWRAMDDGPLDVTWDLTYRWYGDALTFRSAIGPDVRIDDEWRVGIGLARRDRRMRALFFSFDQIGLGYRLSSDGDFRGVTITFSAPLDR